MAQAKFRCISKTGIETFTVQLEADAEAASPACEVCGRRTHEDYCVGGVDGAPAHAVTPMKDGDTSTFKDLPHANIFLSVLTPEAAAQFEEGKVTVVTFALES